MRYHVFLNLALIFFIFAVTSAANEQMIVFIACLVISNLFFKLKDKTLKELFLNLKKDLKIDGDYI